MTSHSYCTHTFIAFVLAQFIPSFGGCGYDSAKSFASLLMTDVVFYTFESLLC